MRTTSSWWLLCMAEAFRRRQLPVKEMFKEAGVSIQSLAHADTRFPQDGVTRLWDVAECLSANDHIGLDMGQQVSVTGFPVLGYSLITASGLADGFQRFLRYQRMIGESANIQLNVEGVEFALDFVFSGDELRVSPHTIDAAMAALVAMARLMEGESWHPKTVLLSRERPTNSTVFEAFYGCCVVFEADRNALLLDPEKLLAEFQQAGFGDPSIDIALQREDKPIAELVEMLIRPKMQDGVINKAQVAQWLSITPRTLQRRLAKEGDTYQGVYDRVRYQGALEYLANPQLSQIEVAFLCGFSDITAFHHAFKRWHGHTPGEYRADLTNTIIS